jgi:hypothetical protein
MYLYNFSHIYFSKFSFCSFFVVPAIQYGCRHVTIGHKTTACMGRWFIYGPSFLLSLLYLTFLQNILDSMLYLSWG